MHMYTHLYQEYHTHVHAHAHIISRHNDLPFPSPPVLHGTASQTWSDTAHKSSSPSATQHNIMTLCITCMIHMYVLTKR